jgi:hypothetical protein
VRERHVDPDLRKVAIRGPSEITTLLEPRKAARRLWPAVVELIRGEIRALIAIGARDIQLDLPQSAMVLADGSWDTALAVETIVAIFDGFQGTIDRVVLELSLPEQWADRHMLCDVDDSIEIAAGIVDVKIRVLRRSTSSPSESKSCCRSQAAETRRRGPAAGALRAHQ